MYGHNVYFLYQLHADLKFLFEYYLFFQQTYFYNHSGVASVEERKSSSKWPFQIDDKDENSMKYIERYQDFFLKMFDLLIS